MGRANDMKSVSSDIEVLKAAVAEFDEAMSTFTEIMDSLDKRVTALEEGESEGSED